MEDVINNQPLVSIVVITYNSSKYVLETLESAKNQNYENIELVISDDGSKDETITICKNWLNSNKGRFVNAQIVTVKRNTGIPANCNRGVKASLGEWVKLIAGDDILLPNCIEDLLNFAVNNNFLHVISDINSLKDGELTDYNYTTQEERNDFFKLNIDQKYRYYLKNAFFLNAPTLLFNKSIIEKIQPFDEDFKLLEDQPYFLNQFRNKIDLGYCNHPTVIYRIHSKSVVGKTNPELIKNLIACFLKYRKPYLPNNLRGKMLKWLIEKDYYIKLKFNGNSFFNLNIRRVAARLKTLLFFLIND